MKLLKSSVFSGNKEQSYSKAQFALILCSLVIWNWNEQVWEWSSHCEHGMLSYFISTDNGWGFQWQGTGRYQRHLCTGWYVNGSFQHSFERLQKQFHKRFSHWIDWCFVSTWQCCHIRHQDFHFSLMSHETGQETYQLCNMCSIYKPRPW